jgi:hypothetical protein
MSYSEDQIRAALAKIDGLMVYKPPDDSRNWKPADFLLWWTEPAYNDFDATLLKAGMLEVKKNYLSSLWHWMGDGPEGLRPSQRAAMGQCRRIGMPYFVAVHWAKHEYWTLHRTEGWTTAPDTIMFDDARTQYGVGCAPVNLAMTLAGVIHGEAGL